MICDDFGTDMEAIDTLRRDVDLEMAEMARTGNAIDRAYAAGRCPHFSVVGIPPDGKPHCDEQVGLTGEQLACTEHFNGCEAVFDDDGHWHDAMEDAIYPVG